VTVTAPSRPALAPIRGGSTSRALAVRHGHRFQYECRDAGGQWWRCYGNELWEFDDGLMRRREASINDPAISESDRRIFGPRPEDERGAAAADHATPLVRSAALVAWRRRCNIRPHA
jgi:Protein of unknown function (DUF1348)